MENQKKEFRNLDADKSVVLIPCVEKDKRVLVGSIQKESKTNIHKDE